MADDFKVRVSGHYSSDGEHWGADLLLKGDIVASIHRLESSADARVAGEYLLLGATMDWKLLHPVSSGVIAAGVEALERPAPELLDFQEQPPESERLVRAVIGAVRLAEVRELLHPKGPSQAVVNIEGSSHEADDAI